MGEVRQAKPEVPTQTNAGDLLQQTRTIQEAENILQVLSDRGVQGFRANDKPYNVAVLLDTLATLRTGLVPKETNLPRFLMHLFSEVAPKNLDSFRDQDGEFHFIRTSLVDSLGLKPGDPIVFVTDPQSMRIGDDIMWLVFSQEQHYVDGEGKHWSGFRRGTDVLVFCLSDKIYRESRERVGLSTPEKEKPEKSQGLLSRFRSRL